MSSPGPGLTSPRGQSLVGAMLLRPKGVSSLKNNKLPRLLQGFFSIEHDMVPRPRRTAATMAAQTANPPHPAPDGDGTVSVDLQRWAPRGPVWETPPSRWVIFSDLHVSPRTLPVCMQILRHVHATATERSAGVAFLGDFWHVRGALPVEPLNDLVRMFATEWNVPALMLVGNHDQVSLGGMVHALTPLAAASPRWVHVFDGPAVYAGALWLPYRRNAHEVAAVLREASSSSAGVEAVFAHADVTGASLNDACQARDGLPPSLFPKGIPTYTGHYHKPHTVPGTSIRYVGSPYQGKDLSQMWRWCKSTRAYCVSYYCVVCQFRSISL